MTAAGVRATAKAVEHPPEPLNLRDHLRGYFARIRAHATIRDTMIRGEHDTHWSNNPGVQRVLNGTHRGVSSIYRGAGTLPVESPRQPAKSR